MSDKRIVAVDSQKLKGIEKCFYFYKLSFLDTLTPKVTPDYFESGSLIHHGLDLYYNEKQKRSSWLAESKNHATVVESCITSMRYEALNMNLAIEDVEKLISSFIQYTDFWENDDWNGQNIFAVEKVYSKILYDSDDLCVLYEGKMDLVLSKSGSLMPIDHKTASSRRDPNELDDQFKGYCFLTDSHTMIKNEIGLQKTLKASEKFKRHVIQYSQATIEEWRLNAVFWVRLMLNLTDAKNFPMNFTSCDKYSGCQYVDLCKRDPEVREHFINELYTIKSWDVGAAHL